jgi:hypothetical protein
MSDGGVFGWSVRRIGASRRRSTRSYKDMCSDIVATPKLSTGRQTGSRARNKV